MTEKELISKIQALKQIKPNKNWASLAKTEILNHEFTPKRFINPVRAWGFSNVFGMLKQKQFAYSLAALLVLFAGVAGSITFGLFNGFNIAQKTPAALVMDTTLQNNVALFKEKSKNLADAANYSAKDVPFALNEVKVAAKNLTETIKKNPELAKSVALEVNNNKTYLDLAGGNSTSEVTDVYKEIAGQLLKDMESETSTPDRKKEIDRIRAEFEKGSDYATVVRDELLLDASKDDAK